MRRNVRKITALILVVVMTIAMLSACSEPATDNNLAKKNIHQRLHVIQTCSASLLEGGQEKIAVDIDTGVMYLVYDGYRRFAITVMLGADGKPLIYNPNIQEVTP